MPPARRPSRPPASARCWKSWKSSSAWSIKPRATARSRASWMTWRNTRSPAWPTTRIPRLKLRRASQTKGGETMIARPNLDLLSALAHSAAPQVVASNGGNAQNTRFDAAMLDAAKTLRDGSQEGVEGTLTPKVEHALETLLQALSQQPADQ